MSLQNDMENAILDHVLGGPSYLRVGTVYLSLHTSAPAEGIGAATEISGNAYARVAITNNDTNWPAAVSGTKSNGAVISFAEATGDWDEVTHWALFPAASGASPYIISGALGAPITVLNGETLQFPIGDLVISAD